MERRKRAILLIVLGLVLTFAGAGLQARYEFVEQQAGAQAQVLLQETQQFIRQQPLSTAELEAPQGQMLQTVIDGHGVLGVLHVEAADITLPVLDHWTYEQLNLGPCRYAGGLATEDLVLMGHNYAGHLAELDRVQPGDAVEFTDVAGERYVFQVAETAVVQPGETEKVTDTDYPFTVFTCTPGGQARFVVYCTDQNG